MPKKLTMWKVIGTVLVAVGLVWLLQGVGLFGGSAMSGVTFWAIMGVIALVLGVLVIIKPPASRK